jgi:deoxyribodipyrimidine photolyase-related protein
VYLLAPEIQKQNYFGARHTLNKKWWTGTTGISPLDDIIKNKIVKYAYTHHIERLMYLGAFMLMLGVAPSQVYNIFMEWTIDAYDWVMVPNIYGMSQFADGGRVMKRPYFSSSNYILKMSNYKRGTWCADWDAVYYAFLNRHRAKFAKNYFYAGQIHNWTSKTATQRATIRTRAAQICTMLTSTKK